MMRSQRGMIATRQTEAGASVSRVGGGAQPGVDGRLGIGCAASMSGAKNPAAVAAVPKEHPDARVRLAALMRAHGDGVYAYSLRMLRDQSLAADVLQQVFEQAFRDIGTLRDERQARSWLFGIAHHRCQDALKARHRHEKRLSNEPAGFEAIPDVQPEAWERVAANQIALALEACVGELSADSRTAVLLRFQEGMTYEHMATVCRERAATLQARVTRALPVLRRCLEAKGVAL